MKGFLDKMIYLVVVVETNGIDGEGKYSFGDITNINILSRILIYYLILF